jgi:hypothetical protein
MSAGTFFISASPQTSKKLLPNSAALSFPKPSRIGREKKQREKHGKKCTPTFFSGPELFKEGRENSGRRVLFLHLCFTTQGMHLADKGQGGDKKKAEGRHSFPLLLDD